MHFDNLSRGRLVLGAGQEGRPVQGEIRTDGAGGAAPTLPPFSPAKNIRAGSRATATICAATAWTRSPFPMRKSPDASRSGRLSSLAPSGRGRVLAVPRPEVAYTDFGEGPRPRPDPWPGRTPGTAARVSGSFSRSTTFWRRAGRRRVTRAVCRNDGPGGRNRPAGPIGPTLFKRRDPVLICLLSPLSGGIPQESGKGHAICFKQFYFMLPPLPGKTAGAMTVLCLTNRWCYSEHLW